MSDCKNIHYEDNVFKRDAKDIVDTLHEMKLFRDDLSRDDMQALEDWIFMTMNTRFSTEKKINKLMSKINNK